MASTREVRGSMPMIVRNDHLVYEGDLKHYFRIIFSAPNVFNDYHNFQHMAHVTYESYEAILYYMAKKLITPLEARLLLIAALFHDMGHFGSVRPDSENIAEAIRLLEQHILPEDRPYLETIVGLMRATEFPHKGNPDELPLMARILRDADMAQALYPAWLQSIVFGFAQERGKAPLEVLKGQVTFLGNLHFYTRWARERFPRSAIEAKVEEVLELIDILEPQPNTAVA